MWCTLEKMNLLGGHGYRQNRVQRKLATAWILTNLLQLILNSS